MPSRPLGRWLALPLFRWSVGIIIAVLLGLVAFELLDVSVFKRIGLAHEYCYLREPRLIWLHVISDALIGQAYVSISATLGYLVHKASREIPFHGIFLAFGLFIVSCGLTHFMEVWVIWEPVYWLSGYIKLVTAAASVATAVALLPLLPKIFRVVDAARESENRKREIEQLNGELERFNYSVAHDLRAPLRGIAGFGEALSADCADELSPTARAYLARMQASVARMDLLISDLLKYATIGRKNLELRAVDLGEVVGATLALMSMEISRRQATVTVASPLPRVIGDPVLLQVVLQNLLGNAIKFVAPGTAPRVEIEAGRVNDGKVALFVTDNGVGIPREARERVFRMFERAHAGHEGSGIGLPIVQRAVERLGGTISVLDAPAGKGTRFRLELPLA
jgi:signal transduction histidine kinase